MSVDSSAALLEALRLIVGDSHIFRSPWSTRRFLQGFRYGRGRSLAVVQPMNLMEQWRVLEACVKWDAVVVMQAANTGLTGGSTPLESYDRPCVLISTVRMREIQLLKNGRQVIAFPGSTLFELETLLKKEHRQPHSVIGSSCIGASVIGGVCNNSGGALIARGPSYTEFALFAKISNDGCLELVNHLGVDLGKEPEEILLNLESRNYDDNDCEQLNRRASDTEYAQSVRDIDADTPARYNQNPQRLYEASGCAGKLAVFAVRLDTYPMPDREQVFFIGVNQPDQLTKLRRVMLGQSQALPVSAEYMHRDCYDLCARYGKDTVILIDWLGTSRLPSFFALKGRIDAWLSGIPLLRNATDRILQLFSQVYPNVLPERMQDFRRRFDHYLILKMSDEGIEEARSVLSEFQAQEVDFEFFACTDKEAKIAALHRYAAAGSTVRYQILHADEVQEVLALDIALRRNDHEWFETLPEELERQIVYKSYCGHFFCHVFHQDYLVRKEADVDEIKHQLLSFLEDRGAEYPAEHNVGHAYTAKPVLAQFYREIDPTNSLNPGVGRMSSNKHYT